VNLETIKNHFPNASPGFIRANLSASASLPDAEQCQRQETLARGYERKAPGAGLLHCRFTMRRKKLLDVDSKYASLKDIIDCLVIARIVDGDKEGQITLEVNQIKCVKGESETVLIEVFKL
jgi:hypothetical protein